MHFHIIWFLQVFKSSLYGTISLDCTHFKTESGRKMSIAPQVAKCKSTLNTGCPPKKLDTILFHKSYKSDNAFRNDFDFDI
jgi:hypothetical protein